MRKFLSPVGVVLIGVTVLLAGCRSGPPSRPSSREFAATPTPFTWGKFPDDLAPVPGWSLTGHTLYLDLYNAAVERVQQTVSSRGPDDLDGDGVIEEFVEKEWEDTLRIDDPVITQVASDLLVQFYSTGTAMQFLSEDLIVRPLGGLLPDGPHDLVLPQHWSGDLLVTPSAIKTDSTVAEVKRFVRAVALGGGDPILCRELPWWQEQDIQSPLPQPQSPIAVTQCENLKKEVRDGFRRERRFRNLEQDLLTLTLGIEVPLDSRSARSGSGFRTFDFVRDVVLFQNILGRAHPDAVDLRSGLAGVPVDWRSRVPDTGDTLPEFLTGDGEQCDSDVACKDCRRSPGSVQEFCGDGALQWWLGEQCDDGGTCLGGTEHGKICSPYAVPSARSTTRELCRAGQGSCVPLRGDGCNEFCQVEGDYCGDAITIYDHDADPATPDIGWEACEESGTVSATSTGRECPSGAACLSYTDCALGGTPLCSGGTCTDPDRVCVNATSLTLCPNGDSDCPNDEENSCRYVFDGVCTHDGNDCQIDAECWGSTFCALDGACSNSNGYVLPPVPCLENSDCGTGEWCTILFGYCSHNPAIECRSNRDCSVCTSESVLGTCAGTGEECASDENCESGYCKLDPSNICRPRDLDDGANTCNQFCSSPLFCGDRITAIGDECDGGMRCRDGTPCAQEEPCRDGSECMLRPPKGGLGCGAECEMQRCGDAVPRTDGASQCRGMVGADLLACLALVEECDVGRTCIDGASCEFAPSICIDKGRCAKTRGLCTPSDGRPCLDVDGPNDNPCVPDSSCITRSGDGYDRCGDTCKKELCGDGVVQGKCLGGVCPLTGSGLTACDSNNDCKTGGRDGEICDLGGFCDGVLGGEPCTADWQCATYQHCFGTITPCTNNSDCDGVSCVSATSGACSTTMGSGCAPDCSYVERCGDNVVQSAPLGRNPEQCDKGSVCIGGPNAGSDCSKDPSVCNCPPQLPGTPPSTCEGGVCATFTGRCVGGPNAYQLCDEHSDCPNSSCGASACMNGCSAVETCHTITCGDGIVDGVGADCAPGVSGVDDDGNLTVDDASEIGWTGSDDETCDDGNTASGDGCPGTCQLGVCGDGVVDPDGKDDVAGNLDDEECEFAKRCGGDRSEADCKTNPPVCTPPAPGDPPKPCSPSCEPGCLLNCKLPPPCGEGCGIMCGDEGAPGQNKECEDRNATPGDGCTASCEIEFCGDGSVDGDGPNNVDNYGGGDDEQCDTGGVCAGDTSISCSKQWECLPDKGPCVHNPPPLTYFCCGGGSCDPNATPPDGCNDPGESGACIPNGGQCLRSCKETTGCCPPSTPPPPCPTTPSCGDGCLQTGEECDDGCRGVCGEICDGGTVDGDGCSSACEVEYCGDGTVNAGVGYNPYWWWGWGWSGYWGPWGGPWWGYGWWGGPSWGWYWGFGAAAPAGWGGWNPWWWGYCGWGYCGWYGAKEQCDPGTIPLPSLGPSCPAPSGTTTLCVPDSSAPVIPPATTGYCTGCYEVRVGDCRVDCVERCDDGNSDSCDGCSSEAKPEYCGDGVVQPKLGEECDPGPKCADGLTSCAPPAPGPPPPFPSPSPWPDGVVTACDDGSSCAMRCFYDTSALPGTICGSSTAPPIPTGLLGCTAGCQFIECGDGFLACNEECDDGNLVSGDGCAGASHPIRVCTREFCGDGYADADGPDNAPGEGGVDDDYDGSTDETDGTEDFIAGSDDEMCDDGWKNNDTQTDACRTTCRIAHCGDGVVDTGEQCDDGNTRDNDGCSNLCEREGCGDGVVQEELGEECDFGGMENGNVAGPPCTIRDSDVGVSVSCIPLSLDGDSCDFQCKWERPPLCGNGIIDPGEECDTFSLCNIDSPNNIACSSHEDCTVGPCILDAPGGSYVCSRDTSIACADSNGLPDESSCFRFCRPCTSSCTFAVTRCGDRMVDAGEECDDGNGISADGCTLCQLDRRDLCGNGVVDPGEKCDGGAIRSLECTRDCQIPRSPPVCGDERVDADQTFGDRMRSILTLREGVIAERGFSLGYQFPAAADEQAGWFVLPERPGGACSVPLENAMSNLCRPGSGARRPSLCGNGVIDEGEECDSGRLGIVNFSHIKANAFQWWRMVYGRTNVLPRTAHFYSWYYNLLPYAPYAWESSLWYPWYWNNRFYNDWYGYWRLWYDRSAEWFRPSPQSSACTAECRLVRCGNGRIDLGEECDDPEDPDCSLNCQLRDADPTGGICGDGDINWWSPNEEECDDGGTCVLKFTRIPPPPPPPTTPSPPQITFSELSCVKKNAPSVCVCPPTAPGTTCVVIGGTGNPAACVPRSFDGCDGNCKIESYGDGPDQEGDNARDCGDGKVNPHDEECDDGGWCGAGGVPIPQPPAGAPSNYCQTHPCPTPCTKINAHLACPSTYQECIPPRDPKTCTASCTIPPFPTPLCGNGTREAWSFVGGILALAEECDNGQHCADKSSCTTTCDDGSNCEPRGGDGCSATCKHENSCGNGVREGQEECDFGPPPDGNNDAKPNTCRERCIFPYCGDKVTDWGEECDDGVTYTCGDGSGCTPGSTCSDGSLCSDYGFDECGFCLSTLCGNGLLDVNESCDDSNRKDVGSSPPSPDGCSRWCLIEDDPSTPVDEKCGDGVVAGVEECDDGNTVSEDGCSARDAIKPNGSPYPCKVEKCGDEIVQGGLGEECDAGDPLSGGLNSWSPNAPCRPTCELPRCGDIDPSSLDPIRDDERGEACDDGRQCLSGPFEGSLCFDDRRCREDLGPCVILSPSIPGTCALDASKNCFGNGYCIVAHRCALRSGDGCSSECIIEPGWQEDGSGGVEESCQDTPSDLDPGEECDDGNAVNGDGCSEDCRLEQSDLCGNFVIDQGEQCDDGNRAGRDGCSATCQIERVSCTGDCTLTTAFSCDAGKPCSDLPARTCNQGTANPADDTTCSFHPGCAFDCRFGFCGNGVVDAGEECDRGDDGDPVCTRFCQARALIHSGTTILFDTRVRQWGVGSGEVVEAREGLLELQTRGSAESALPAWWGNRAWYPWEPGRSWWSPYSYGYWHPWYGGSWSPFDRSAWHPWGDPVPSSLRRTIGGHLQRIVQAFETLRTTDAIPDRTSLFPLEPVGIASFPACQETKPVLTPLTGIPPSVSLNLPSVLPGQVVAEIERLLCSEGGLPRLPFSFLCSLAEERGRHPTLSTFPIAVGGVSSEDVETRELRERILLQSEEIGVFLGGSALQELIERAFRSLGQQITAATSLLRELTRIEFATDLCPFSGTLCGP